MTDEQIELLRRAIQQEIEVLREIADEVEAL